MRFICTLGALVLAAAVVSAQTLVKDTKHNLSLSGPGTIKASAEQEICVFCHTPHQSSSAAQLWNHVPTTQGYALYSSDYLTSKGYTSPAQPKAKSKLCMSCHDGTIALGAVYNSTGSGTTGSIPMGGPVTTMPPTSTGNLGVTLTDDHPVGYGYDNAKDPELVVKAWPWGGSVKLDPDASNGTVECQTCHTPHNNANGSFLQLSNANAALCTACHAKTNWSASIHRTSTQGYTPPGSAATTIGEWACRNCHQSHGGTGAPYILRLQEESTCFASACHGTTPSALTKDIQTQATKTYAHPTTTVTGKHKKPDTGTSINASNRHAECQDCHNPHQAKDGLHTLKSNAVSNVLAGAEGVTAGSASIWTQPTTFTAISQATAEYQICFRCHSYNAFGAATNGVTTILGPSGINITDQAMEYNPANKSAHPVQVNLNGMTGSVVTKALATQQMKAAWNSVGTQTMYCSDCHGSDQAVSATVPDGPHGSARKFMLKGSTTTPNAQYWPNNAGGTAVWTLANVRNNTNSWSTNLFCVNCHPIYTGGTWMNTAHSEHATRNVTIGGQAYTGIPCVSCHVTVPHGSKRGRLIAYRTDVPPYNYLDVNRANVQLAIVTGYKKAARNSYSKSNCYSTQSGCTTHTNAGGYDP